MLALVQRPHKRQWSHTGQQLRSEGGRPNSGPHLLEGWGSLPSSAHFTACGLGIRPGQCLRGRGLDHISAGKNGLGGGRSASQTRPKLLLLIHSEGPRFPWG